MKARTRGRPQLLQAAQPHHQRRCAGHTGLQVMLRAHRAVSRVDGLAQAGRVLSGGAAHLQARKVSSVRKISPTSSELVTSGCSLGSASTCERRAGDWQHSAAMGAAPRRSSVPGCTCSQVLAQDTHSPLRRLGLAPVWRPKAGTETPVPGQTPGLNWDWNSQSKLMVGT